MRKLFLKISMLLFVLAMSVNAAWATHIGEANGGYTPEQAVENGFWARLTAKPATTTNGTGKVFVVADYNYESDPEAGDYATQKSDEDWSDIYLASNMMNADVSFRAYAKSDDGSYFTGWSFTDGNTDLGTKDQYHSFSVEVTPSAKAGKTNIREYFLYAAFLPVQLVSYELVSGSQEVNDDGNGNWTCTQNIIFRAETPNGWALSGSDDVRHFKLPVVTKKAGTTGTWSVGVSEWTNSNISFHGDYAELTIPVTFTAPNGDPNDYAATLTLETKAGVKMTAYVYARKSAESDKEISLYDGKVYKTAIDFSDLDETDLSGYANPIVKLNKDITNNAVSIDKSLTLDLNGHNMNYFTGTALTISGGEVTLAYSPYGGQIGGWQQPSVVVSAGKLVLNGGTIMCGNNYAVAVAAGAELEQNGASIGGKTAAIASQGKVTTTGGKIKGLVGSTGASAELIINGGVFDNLTETISGVSFGGAAIQVGGGFAQIKKGIIKAQTYGVQVDGGSVSIEKLAAISGNTKALKRTAGTLTVKNGKFASASNFADGEIVFESAYFGEDATSVATAYSKQLWRNTAGVEFNEGYYFFVGDQDAAQASNVSVCRIGLTAYNSLEEALAYANNSGKEVIIIMENDYTLKAGYYTIPSNATLIVPMSNDQKTANSVVPREASGSPTPVCFRKLIFESGVNMEVAGTIEVSCTQYGTGEQMGIPGGNYGHLILKPGSHMTINNGGYLRAWGFVTGDGTKDAEGNYLSGEIDVRRGGTVHEMFQMGDWKGGDISFTIAMEVPGMTNWRDMAHLFPIYTYFIQNVESPVKYHPGASLICATSVNVAGSINAYANDIKVVGKEGEPAMFLMNEMADAENTWVRKYYDAKKDQQVYEVNSGAKLGSMVIDLGELPGSMLGASGTFPIVLDSRKFVLPLTSNFKIHLLSGYMEFTQSTSCLPGMEVEVDKESEVSIVKNEDASIVSGALYFYDADQWSFQNMAALNPEVGGYVGNSGKFGAIVRYSPTWDLDSSKPSKPNVRNISSPAAIGDAILNVHGTFRMGEGCAVYTTWAKDNTLMALDESEGATGGASVISSNEDAGTFIFDADAPAFDGIHMSGMNITGFGPNVIVNYDHNDYGITSPMAYPVKIPTVLNKSTPTPVFGIELCTPVKLKNGDGTFVETSTTTAGTSYCYRDGHWTTMQVAEDECFMKEIVGGQTTYYAKPAEYVAVNATWDGSKMLGNADHTYSDKAGAGRLFILMKDDCQWWEVEKKDNLYHCIHPNNDTYYYWDGSKWAEQRFTITWKNWDGTEIKSYIYDAVTGDPEEVEYSVTYGTQAEYHGSNPTREPSEDYTYDFAGWNPELGPVKSNVTYTATYTQQPRKYTIIFTEEGGKEIERQFLTHNEMPVCENTPTQAGHTLQWEPEIQAVTGDATYRATWLENPPTEYEVTFFDYNGTTVLKRNSVAVGLMPTPPANPSGKPATTEYSYVFDHWSPAVEKVSAQSAKTYTAVYREVAREYTIRYYKEDGVTPNATKASESLPYGATPIPPVVEKENPAIGYTYTLVWKTVDESAGIQTVMANASYKPTYLTVPNKYSVTVKSNPSGACSFTGAGMYEYGASATVTLTPNEGYSFTGWSDGLESTNTTRTMTVTADKELVANFNVTNPNCTIVWKNGDVVLATVYQKSGTATTYTGATPTKDATAQYTYTFDGWSTTKDGDKEYKNGLTPVAPESGTVTYYAHFAQTVNQYKVTLKSNPAGVATFTGAGTYDYNNAVTVAVADYNHDNFTFTGWSNDNVNESQSFAITANVELTAYFTTRGYTVTWKKEDGTGAALETDADLAYGTKSQYNGATPTKAADEPYTYEFDGWTTAANGEGAYYANGNTPAVTGDVTYYAHFRGIVPDMNIANGATTTLTAATVKNNLVITSDGYSNSGELIGSEYYLTLQGDAHFDMTINAKNHQWYAVAVPWQVDARTGISVNGKTLALGKDFDILYYDGARRAAEGKVKAWQYVEDDGDKTLIPGRLYMIGLMSDAAIVRFTKKAGADLLTTMAEVDAYAQSTGDATDANWNGVANPALFKAYVNPGVDEGQKYDPDAKTWGVFDFSEGKLVVGQGAFVQAPNPKSIVVSTGGSYAAPRRAEAQNNNVKFDVRFAAEGATYADRLFVKTTDEKEEEGYVIGQDLVKFSVSSAMPQMWINRYDQKLCVNTTELINETAEYPLGIYAPASGNYTIANVNANADYALYLTYNGEAIWNLSEAPYTLVLNKGIDANYGLRISVKNAPQTATGIDEAEVNAQGETRKVLIDNKVFIIRGGKVYSIDGQLVK